MIKKRRIYLLNFEETSTILVRREINKVFRYISKVIKRPEVDRGLKGALSSVG